MAWKPTTPTASPNAAAVVSFELNDSEEEAEQLWRDTADMLNKAGSLEEARWRFFMGAYGEVECFVPKPQLRGIKHPLAMPSASKMSPLIPGTYYQGCLPFLGAKLWGVEPFA